MTGIETGTPDLEARLSRLESIVAALERDDLELEEALRLFEEGIGHIRATRELLAAAELRITYLLENDDGDAAPQADTVSADE